MTNSIVQWFRNEKNRKMFYFISVFMIISILGRFVVHLPNFTPIGALALFSGFYLSRKVAMLVPLSVMFLSDLFIGFYTSMVMVTVYASFAIFVLLGSIYKNQNSAPRILGATFAGSLFFFFATNLSVWAFTNYYEHTVSGLMYCFTLALPFLKFSLLGDFFWVAIFFGSYHYFTSRSEALYGSLQTATIRN